MNIDTFNEAVELRKKYTLCEKVMEYLSDPDAVKGMKYKETLALFVKKFDVEFMTFVHQQLEKVGMAFDELHCPEHSDTEKPKEPETPPADAKFKIGDRVRIIKDDLIPILVGRLGTVEDYDSSIGKFGVRLDGFSADAELYWFASDEIEPYTEEENPDEPKDEKPEGPPESDQNGFTVGDRVEIIAGGLTGRKGTVVGFDFEQNMIDVLLDGDDDSVMFTPTEIQKITPDEDGDGDTDPAEGE